jgi:PmbA protein
MECLEKILDKSSSVTEESELFYLKNSSEKLEFEANELQSMTGKESEGTGLRVRKDGKIGFITSSRIEEDIIEKAILSAEFGDDSTFSFSGKHENFSSDYIDRNIDNINIDTLVSRGEDIIKEIRSFDKKINVNITFEKRVEEVHLLTSGGFMGHYKKNHYSMFVRTEFTRENDIFEIWKGFSDRETAGKEERLVSELLFDIKHGMSVVKIQNGKYPVLFSPDVVEELLSIFVTGVDGNRIYRKTSPLYSKLGQEIFNETISIYDDPSIKGGANSCPFDDEGVVSQKTPLVEKGILKGFLLDLKNSVKLNMPSSGNGFRKNWITGRSYEYYPSINPSCITINPGSSSYEELLSSMKEGIFVKSVPDLCMGNIQNGDFAGTVIHGFKVEQGNISGRIKNTVISGNLYNLLKNQLLGMSKDLYYSISSGARVPYMLFRDVEVTS